MLIYFVIFILSLLVDIIPFFGPPAWTVMVFFQIKYDLDIWMVLIAGVIGSTIGRYFLAYYIPFLSSRILNNQKNIDLQFLGRKLGGNKWRVQLFVLMYTLTPVPTTPLFTAIGMARINPLHIITAFFIGKFISDALMVHAGKFAAENADSLIHGLFSWKSITGSVIGLIIILVFLFIDWRTLIQEKKFRLKFNIWK